MTIRAVGVARLVGVPTTGLAAAVAIAPSRWEIAAHVWLVTVFSLAALAGLVMLRRAVPPRTSGFGHRSDADPAAPLLALERIEREVSVATASAYDVHFRLRPLLRECAQALLAAKRGVELDREPARARALLGEAAWDLVRPDRAPPTDPREVGIDRARLEQVVVAMERL